MKPIKLEFLDHVGICVKDIEVSANWYQSVLGLKRFTFDKWGPFPIFMLSGKSGIAIFPANGDVEQNSSSPPISIDHFAFNVNKENFDLARQNLTKLNIEFEYKNHHYFESIYFKDPDDHIVELTTILVDEEAFYNKER